MNEPLILETRKVNKFYPDGQVQALREVSLPVREGEVLLIHGPSGGGKSTLLHILGGLDTPTSGEVLFRGIPLSSAEQAKGFRVRNVGFVFQSFYLWSNLNVGENILLPLLELEMTTRERTERVNEAVGQVGLADKMTASIRNLSIGQRQRVAVARALVAGPSLILADEPTGSLDSANAENIFRLLRKINREARRTIVMVTHGEPPGDCYDRKVEIRDGQLLLST